MLPSPQPAKEALRPGSTQDAIAVRAQLNRLLAHPLFTNSRRYPILLSFTVEQTLLGNAAELKERTIGIEAFGREPDYDANADPVVRIAAAEVRRRLVQYYHDPSHAGELVIELSAGSYVPAFREPEQVSQALTTPNAEAEVLAIPARLTVIDSPGPVAKALRPQRRNWLPILAAGLLAGVAGIAIGRYQPPRTPSNVERFWEPITSSLSPVTYCLGEPGVALNPNDPRVLLGLSGRLDVSDVVTLARTIVPLVPRHGAFRVLPASEASFAQLREGPIVLIGAFDNPWTMRITRKLRFGFEVQDGVTRLVDRKSPQQSYWTLQWDVPGVKLAKDYAVVARLHDSMTGQPVIIVAGILSTGTEAASEVLYNPVYLDSLLARAPKNWDRLNLEAVMETRVIEGHSGPPNILAVETW